MGHVLHPPARRRPGRVRDRQPAEPEVPPPAKTLADPPVRRAIVTPAGHEIELHEAKQSVTATTATGQTVTLDPQKIEVTTAGGGATLEVELAPGSGALPDGAAVVREYCDGAGWVGFVAFASPTDPHPELLSRDGTSRLARSGTVLLRAGERAAAPTEVRGVKGHGVRARLRRPPDPDRPRTWTATRRGSPASG